MNNLPENELLSAYLDGELTAEEQARAERLLEESPAARKLLDQLRTLSSTLQAMPQYKLGEDLSDAVLRDAEREILTRPVPAASEPLGGRIPDWRRFVNGRSLAWSGIAVAVAVMLMVYNPQDRNPVEIAGGPKPGSEVAVDEVPKPHDGELRLNRPGEDRTGDGMAIRGAEGYADKGGYLNARALTGAEADDERTRLGIETSHGTQTIADETLSTNGGGTVASKGQQGLSAARRAVASRGVPATPSMPDASEQKADRSFGMIARKPAPATSLPDDAMRPNAMARNDGKAQKDFRGTVVDGTVAGRLGRQLDPSDPLGPGPGAAQGKIVGKGVPSDNAALSATVTTLPSNISPHTQIGKSNGAAYVAAPIAPGDRLFEGVQLAQAADGHAMVFCDISPAVLQKKTFTRLLGKNEIAVGEVALERNVRLKAKAGSQAVQLEMAKKLATVQNGRDGGFELSLGEGARQEIVTLDEAAIAQWADAEQVDVYYVEATAEQLKATFGDLEQRSEDFLAVSIKQDTAASRARRGRPVRQDSYNREAGTDGEPARPEEVIAEMQQGREALAGDVSGGMGGVGGMGLRGMGMGSSGGGVPPTGTARQSGVLGKTSDSDIARSARALSNEPSRTGTSKAGPSIAQSPVASTQPEAEGSPRPISPAEPKPTAQVAESRPGTTQTETTGAETAASEAPELPALVAPVLDPPARDAPLPEDLAQQVQDALPRFKAEAPTATRRPDEAEPPVESDPSLRKQPGDFANKDDLAKKAEADHAEQAEVPDQPAADFDVAPGGDDRGGMRRERSPRPVLTDDAQVPGFAVDSQTQRVQGDVDQMPSQQATYRVFFVLRVVGGSQVAGAKQAGPVNAAVMDREAEVQAAPVTANPAINPPPAVQAPAEVAPRE